MFTRSAIFEGLIHSGFEDTSSRKSSSACCRSGDNYLMPRNTRLSAMSSNGTANRQIRPGAATFAHDLYHAIPFPRAGRKQNLAQAVCELHPICGFHRAPLTFEYVRRD